MSTDDLKLIQLRRMKESDVAYIYDTWMEDYLSAHYVKMKSTDKYPIQTWVALMPRELYYKEQRARIDKILKKSIVMVACNQEDEDQIFGYIVYRSISEHLDLVSAVYVRHVYRNFGICGLLFKHMGNADIVTHCSPKRRWLLKRYNLIFNPFMEEIDD